jgi:hypothetical protein
MAIIWFMIDRVAIDRQTSGFFSAILTTTLRSIEHSLTFPAAMTCIERFPPVITGAAPNQNPACAMGKLRVLLAHRDEHADGAGDDAPRSILPLFEPVNHLAIDEISRGAGIKEAFPDRGVGLGKPACRQIGGSCSIHGDPSIFLRKCPKLDHHAV